CQRFAPNVHACAERCAPPGPRCRTRPGSRQDVPVTNLLGEPPATLLPDDPTARKALDAGTDPREVAAAHPSYAAAWAALAEAALAAGEPVMAYAYARTGYHRSLDQLRRAGWKGHGPVPWEHEPNR